MFANFLSHSASRYTSALLLTGIGYHEDKYLRLAVFSFLIFSFFLNAREVRFNLGPDSFFFVFFSFLFLFLTWFEGAGLFDKFRNLGKALKFAYPEFDWNEKLFSFRGKKSAQRWLYVKLKDIIPENVEIFEDFLHPDLLWGVIILK